MQAQNYLNNIRSHVNLFTEDEIRYITLTFFILLTYFTPYIFLSFLTINTLYYFYENYKVNLHIDIKKNDVINDELDTIIKNSFKDKYVFDNLKEKNQDVNKSIKEMFEDDDTKPNENIDVFDPDYDDMPPLISDNDSCEEENELVESKFDEFPSPIINPMYINGDNEILKILSSQNL